MSRKGVRITIRQGERCEVGEETLWCLSLDQAASRFKYKLERFVLEVGEHKWFDDVCISLNGIDNRTARVSVKAPEHTPVVNEYTRLRRRRLSKQ